MVGRPFRVWEPFLFALELWLVVLGLSSLFLYGGLFLDSRLETAPVFATLGLGAAFLSSLSGGLLLVRRATGRPLLGARQSRALRRAAGYALRLAGIVVGCGAVGVYGGWFLDGALHTRPLLTVIGIVLGYAASVSLGLRFTRAVLRRVGRGATVKRLRVLNATRGTVLAERAELADSFFGRFLGLMGGRRSRRDRAGASAGWRRPQFLRLPVY